MKITITQFLKVRYLLNSQADLTTTWNGRCLTSRELRQPKLLTRQYRGIFRGILGFQKSPLKVKLCTLAAGAADYPSFASIKWGAGKYIVTFYSTLVESPK